MKGRDSGLVARQGRADGGALGAGRTARSGRWRCAAGGGLVSCDGLVSGGGLVVGRGLAPVLLLAFALLAPPSGSAADEAGLARLAEARALWQAAAPRDYRYGYRKYCECTPDSPPETVVTVLDGLVEEVYVDHGEGIGQLPALEGSRFFYWTIEDLFAKLESALAGEATVRANYDATLGYPTTLFIDYDPGFAGDESDLRLTRVEIL